MRARRTLSNDPLIITEGELDALSAIQAGFPRAISVPDGAGSNLDFVGEIWPLLKNAHQSFSPATATSPARSSTPSSLAASVPLAAPGWTIRRARRISTTSFA